MQAKLCLVLHAHLPFVKHPEFDEFLEEDWLYEALTETYIPLVDSLQRLQREKIPWKLAISISPTLACMLSDSLIQKRYQSYLAKRAELSQKEQILSQKHPLFYLCAEMYQRRYQLCIRLMDRYGWNLLRAFRELMETGNLELLCCNATHALLPSLPFPEAIQAQIETALQTHQEHFGMRPKGMWLAECGYDHRLDTALKEAGIQYFFSETHALLYARPRPKHGPYAPIATPTGVAVLARDPETAHQVWSAEIGYPGDPAYREFYRDLGFDGDTERLRLYLPKDGIRRNLGLKYFRITGKVPLDQKEPYEAEAAFRQAEVHAAHFLWCRQRQADSLTPILKKAPTIVAMYDAELFGHWWFEGVHFLEHLFKKLALQSVVQPMTPFTCIEEAQPLQQVQPEISTWGDKGYFEVWLNNANDWIYHHVHEITRRMIDLANHQRSALSAQRSALTSRALNQAAREVLLAQASDWPFILTTGSHMTYAQQRIAGHVQNFLRLEEQIQRQQIEPNFLEPLEQKNSVFPKINYRAFSSKPSTNPSRVLV